MMIDSFETLKYVPNNKDILLKILDILKKDVQDGNITSEHFSKIDDKVTIDISHIKRNVEMEIKDGQMDFKITEK